MARCIASRRPSRNPLTPNDVISWVVGRGGLLGRSVEPALGADSALWQPRRSFSWGDEKRSMLEIHDAARDFASTVGNHPWRVAWCAGSGFVGTPLSALEGEKSALSALLDSLADAPQLKAANGSFFLASSAGGVYAGADAAPYSEDSPVVPLSEYGRTKLEQEHIAARWSNQTSVPLLIGRLTNLYGPDQDLAKGQGLINQVCLRIIARRPLRLYVPIDTMRDYLYARDAGRLVADALRKLRLESLRGKPPLVVTKILASHQPATIATVLAQFKWITKRPVSVTFATSSDSRFQVRDLRVRSTTWTELDRRPFTPLSEGMRAVLERTLQLAGSGHISLEAVEVQ